MAVRKYTEFEKLLFRFLRDNNILFDFIKLLKSYKYGLTKNCIVKYNDKLSIHQNLLNQHYGRYLSPKNIFWCLVGTAKPNYAKKYISFWDEVSTKWEAYYFKNKICTKSCKNLYGYIQEKEYAKKR